VDYAHTPDALETVLKNIRPCVQGKLHLVFGCGGNRDPIKRPKMGEIAGTLADVVIVTDDNPRMEDPALIRAAVINGCKNATEIPGRREAILNAIANLRPGDVLLVAGKGHEEGQIIGTETLPFNDKQEIESCIKELQNV